MFIARIEVLDGRWDAARLPEDNGLLRGCRQGTRHLERRDPIVRIEEDALGLAHESRSSHAVGSLRGQHVTGAINDGECS